MLDTPRFPSTEVRALPETAVPVLPETDAGFFAQLFQRKTPRMMTPTMIRMVLKLNFLPPEDPEDELV